MREQSISESADGSAKQTTADIRQKNETRDLAEAYAMDAGISKIVHDDFKFVDMDDFAGLS